MNKNIAFHSNRDGSNLKPNRQQRLTLMTCMNTRIKNDASYIGTYVLPSKATLEGSLIAFFIHIP